MDEHLNSADIARLQAVTKRPQTIYQFPPLENAVAEFITQCCTVSEMQISLK